MAPGGNSTEYAQKKWGVVAWAIFINYMGRDLKPQPSKNPRSDESPAETNTKTLNTTEVKMLPSL